MNFRAVLTVVVFLSASWQAKSANLIETLSCIDCFNFAAPSVVGAENISPAEVGLIVLDTDQDRFRGYSSSTGWQTLSNKKNMYSSSSTETINIKYDLIVASASSASITLTLPTAVGNDGKVITFQRNTSDTSANTITLDGNSTETIDGSATVILGQNLKIVSDGTNWLSLAEKNRIQTKFLNSDVTSTGVLSGLTFTNLTVGKWYTVKGKFYNLDVGSSNTDLQLYIKVLNGTTLIEQVWNRIQGGGLDLDSVGLASKFNLTFQATNSTVTFDVDTLTNLQISGNGTTAQSFVQMVERHDLISTSSW